MQLITEDQAVGTWVTIKHSRAAREPEGGEALERITRLRDAVKIARETANAADAPRKDVGKKVMAYLFDE